MRSTLSRTATPSASKYERFSKHYSCRKPASTATKSGRSSIASTTTRKSRSWDYRSPVASAQLPVSIGASLKSVAINSADNISRFPFSGLLDTGTTGYWQLDTGYCLSTSMDRIVFESVRKVFRHRPALFNLIGRERRGETSALKEKREIL